jgi:predicted CopG family antitoxin
MSFSKLVKNLIETKKKELNLQINQMLRDKNEKT